MNNAMPCSGLLWFWWTDCCDAVPWCAHRFNGSFGSVTLNLCSGATHMSSYGLPAMNELVFAHHGSVNAPFCSCHGSSNDVAHWLPVIELFISACILMCINLFWLLRVSLILKCNCESSTTRCFCSLLYHFKAHNRLWKFLEVYK